MQKWQMPRSQESVAIRDPSGDTVVRQPNEVAFPEITGKLREDGSDDNVTAIEQKPPFKNGEKESDDNIKSAYE